MNALVRHVWGESAAADSVWEQVVGMRPALAVAQPIMVLQAFMDDSRSGRGDGIFVLGGCIAPAEAWARFAPLWEELLALAPLDENLERNFKFSEFMRAGQERVQHLATFARVIADHVLCSVVFVMDVKDLRRAQRRVQIPGRPIDFGDWANPYLIAFLNCLGNFHGNRDKFPAIVGENEEIRFIFDEQSEKTKILRGWDSLVETLPSDDLKARFRIPPRFEDDKKFLPLQAADLISGWFRHRLERRMFAPTETGFVFDSRGAEIEMPAMKGIVLHMREPHIVNFMMAMARSHVPRDQYVCDINVEFQ